MPSRHSAVALAALAALGLATGCEKQNPYVTVTAGGVVVKARAVRYCRGDDCRVTNDTPTLTVRNGDVLGVDVPRSVADDGWRVSQQGEVSHEHYITLPIEGRQPGVPLQLSLFRAGPDFGEWRFTLDVK
jgi:hypothetical protein